MNRVRNDHDAEMARHIDRLACGELAEQDRGQLLSWLEEEPLRWRRCGLALLEAQTWRHALGEWDPSPPEKTLAPKPSSADCTRRQSASRTALLWLSAISLGLLLAFGLGMAAGEGIAALTNSPAGKVAGDADNRDEGGSADSQDGHAVLASISVHSEGGGEPTQMQIPLVPTGENAAPQMTTAKVPDHIRRQWEGRGYKIRQERRYLFATLPDGRQVVVPVDQIKLEYVGAEVY